MVLTTNVMNTFGGLAMAVGRTSTSCQTGEELGQIAAAMGDLMQTLRTTALDSNINGTTWPRDDGVEILEIDWRNAYYAQVIGVVWWPDQRVDPLLADLLFDDTHKVLVACTVSWGDTGRRWTREEVERAWRRAKITSKKISWRFVVQMPKIANEEETRL